MEQNRAWRTWPMAVVSSTRGYWTARGRIMQVKILIYPTDRAATWLSEVNSPTKRGERVWVTTIMIAQKVRHSPTIIFRASTTRRVFPAP